MAEGSAESRNYGRIILTGLLAAAVVSLLGALWLLIRGEPVTTARLAGPLFWAGAVSTAIFTFGIGPVNPGLRRSMLKRSPEEQAEAKDPVKVAEERRNRDQISWYAGSVAIFCWIAAFGLSYL